MTAEDLGKIVRMVWVDYCKQTGKTDKPDHIAPWEELNEWGKEVDRRIGVEISNAVLAEQANIEEKYIGVCALLAKLYGPIDRYVDDNLDYLCAIDRALNDFQKLLGGRFEILRKVKTNAPYAVEPKRLNSLNKVRNNL